MDSIEREIGEATLQQEVLNITVRKCEFLGESFVTASNVQELLRESFGEISSEQLVRATYHLNRKGFIARKGLGKWVSNVKHEARGNKVCKALKTNNNEHFCPVKNVKIVNPRKACRCDFIVSSDDNGVKQQLKPLCPYYQ